jgi:amino acid adenylation domain-containing protein
MMVGLLAIMKAGGAYVPLDLSYPKERLFFMLEDAGAAVLLTEERFEDALAEQSVPIICLDADWHEIADESEEPPAVDVTTGNLAYVIYTSGSTGRPKGVQISHSALFNLIAWHCRRFDLSGQDRATQLAGVGFDASVWEVWPYLVSGASLHLPDEDTRTSPEALRDWLTLEQVTISFLPTPLAEAVMALGGAEGAALRMMLTGGDKLNKYPSSGAGYELINNYGPTENSVVATSGEVAREERFEQGPTIGRPIDNVQVYILDRHQRPAGAGLVGELHIGGRSLARGYLNRAELTAEKFIPSPFDREPGRRLYKTGDLVRHRPDGQIEFVGRADYQVKIRGYRIELGEVEAALRQQAGVEDAVVVAREEGEGGRRLIAYVVGKLAPGAGELRSALEDRLPDYMVPSAFVMIDALPLTQNGKVDRQALPIPDVTTGRSDGLFKSPHTPVEEMLAGIWSRVLGVEKVGVSDNFFEMGGHSLQATRVISRMREVFDLEAPLRWLFEAPTVAELAARVEIARQNRHGLEAPPLARSTQDVEAPLSFAQQRLWFTEQLVPGTNLYNNSVGVRFKGALNLIALRQSFDEVLRRHEALRTALVSKKGEAFQVVAPSSHLDIPMIDLSALPEEERERKCRQLARQQSAIAFDLGQAPLMRAALLCMQADEWVVLVTMHHLVTDNWSVGVFVRELGSLYQDFSDSIPSRLPELAIQYLDFARWQRGWLQGEALDAQLGYWKQQLEGAPRLLRLPTDRPRPIKRSFRCSSQPLSVPRDLFEKIERLSRQEGVTLFMTLLAAYQTLLFRYTGQDDICVGSPIANRNRAEIEDLIGYFVNILVLRTDLSGNPSFQELLKRVREVTLGAYAHQDLPFETLVDALRPDRNLNHSRLVQATFTFQNAPMRALELPRLTLTPVAIGNQAIVEYDLSLIIAGEAGGLSGNLVYNSDLFDGSTIARLLDHFIVILEQAAADPERPLLDIQLQRDDSAELHKTTSLIEEYGVHQFML